MKDILGFQINGIGNGHITAANVVYDVLIKYYEIPVIIIYGKNYNHNFSKDKVKYINIKTTNESTNDMDLYKITQDIIKPKKSYKYEKKYNINKWFNFCIIDFFNFRTKQLCITHHLSIDNKLIDILTMASVAFSNIKLISIHTKSKHTQYVIPPLIELNKLDKNRTIKKKIILAYSVSGTDFQNAIYIIAKKNPLYQIKYFTLSKIKYDIPENITLYKPDKKEFKNFFNCCSCVLCTAGNELILECVYNNVPVATMPCSSDHFEQVENCKKYVNKLKYAYLIYDNLKLDELASKDTTLSNNHLNESLRDREKKIIELCNI